MNVYFRSLDCTNAKLFVGMDLRFCTTFLYHEDPRQPRLSDSETNLKQKKIDLELMLGITVNLHHTTQTRRSTMPTATDHALQTLINALFHPPNPHQRLISFLPYFHNCLASKSWIQITH
jgi:hypothetical protein